MVELVHVKYLLTSSTVSSVRAVTPQRVRDVKLAAEANISMAKGEHPIPMASKVDREHLARRRLMMTSRF